MTTKKLTDYLKQQTPTQSSNKIEQAKPAPTRIRFKKETVFQETPIGKIPKEWRVTELGELGKLVDGYAFPLEYQGKRDLRYLFVKVSDTNIRGNEKYIYTTENTIDDAIASRIGVKIYPPGTIIFPKIGEVIKLRKVRILARHGTFDNNLLGVIPSEEVVHREYLYYYLLAKVDFTRLIGGSTTPALRKSQIARVKIALPPMVEQKAIAEILSSVDSAIEKVRLLVDRAERFKKGLMHELLTKGIGHKEYKETPIGKIPKEWRVCRLSEIATDMCYGVTAKAVEYNTGIRFLRTTDIKDYKVRWDSLPYCEITSNNKVNVSKYVLRKGDIVVSRAGTVGMSIYVENDMPDTVFGSYLIKIRVNDGVVNPKFLHYYFQTEQYWRQILASSKGSTLKNISLPILKSLHIPVPPLREQETIVKILSDVDAYMERIHGRLERIERIKKELMNALLTGKVRVIVESSEGVFYG